MGTGAVSSRHRAEGRHIVVANCGDGSVAGGAGGGRRPARRGDRTGRRQQGRVCRRRSRRKVRVRVRAGERSSARLSSSTRRQASCDPRPAVPAKAGAAPRQIAFRPDAQFAYVLNQKSSTVTTFAYDAATGALKEIESVSTVPEYFDGPNTAHDLRVHNHREISVRVEHGVTTASCSSTLTRTKARSASSKSRARADGIRRNSACSRPAGIWRSRFPKPTRCWRRESTRRTGG